MTLAVDKRTGAVVGQLVRLPLNVDGACHTPKDHPDRFIYAGKVRLLTRGGRYVTVPRSSVRLEVVR